MDRLSPPGKKCEKSGNNSDSGSHSNSENDNSVLIISQSHSRNNSQTSSNSDESDAFNTENLDQLLMKANLNINLNPSPLNRNKNTNTNKNQNQNRNCNKNMNDESDIKENKENSNHLKIDSGSSIDSISAPNMMDLLQRELYEKSQKLKVAYQASLELVEQNDSLHEQVESLEASIEMLQNSITDYELTIEQLKVEKEELSETVSAAQQGYEQIFGELTATQEKLYHAMDTIHDYERTIDQNSENAASMSVANDEYIKNVETNYKRELSMYKNKCEEISNEKSQLLKELEKYRYSDRKFNDLAEKYDDLKLERSQMNEKEKVLSDQLLELTYDKVALEKELQKMHKKMFEKENEVCELQNKTEELQHQLMSNNPQASNLMANSRFSRLYSYAAASGAKVGDNHTPPSDNGSFQFGVNDDSSALLARRLSKSLQSSRYYHNNSLLAELAGQIDPTSMYDDIRRSVSYEDGAKRRDSISRSHSPSNEREVSASPPAEESISDLSQLKDSGVREAISPHDGQDDAEQKVAATELHESKSFSPARADDRQNRKDDDEKEMESKNNTNEKNKNKNKTKMSSENEEKKKENSRSKSSKGQKSVSPPLIRAKNTRKSDALEEYLHLTASAVKINYPSVDVSAAELIDRVRNLPFYQAHNALTRYMMERLQWEQIEQQRILQIKAAAIAAKEKESQLKRQNSGNFSKLFSRMFGGSSSTTSATNKSNHKNGNNDAGNNGNNIDHNRSQSTGALNGSNVTPMSGNNNNMHHSTMSTMSERERIQLNMINQVKPRATVTGGASLNLGSLEPPTHQVSSAKSRQYHSYRNDNLASNNKSKASTMAGVSNIHASGGGGSSGNVGTKVIGASESPLTEHEQYLNNIKLNQGFPSPQIRNKNNKQVLSALDKHNKMVDLMITEPYSNPNKNRSNNKNRQIKRYTTEEIARYLTKSGSGSSVISANKFPDKVSYLQAMRLRQQQYDRFRNELATANQRELDRNNNNNTINNDNNNNHTNDNNNTNSSGDNSDSKNRKTNNDNNEKIHRSMSNNSRSSSNNNNNNKKKNKNKNSMNSMNNDNENNTILGLMSGKSNVLPLPLPSLQEHSEKGSIDTSPSKSQSKKSTLNTNNDAASPISNKNDNENVNDNDNDTGTTMTTTTNSNQSKQ